ncbi:heme oxygenase-like protein [Setomelanomma holmii]|uniref:Heme oxygenase-like protein n=1 Tax=Setomelanomma holmii TaxID=210430 RepID=A0A9P4GWF9_9PLEO|nr:heme oxygenase-like protein [Setomelanomma holmii]
MNKYFDEFFDDSLGHKCVRVRCQSCGFVRAKNATRQGEHLTRCKEFLSTTEGAELLTSGSLAPNQQQDQDPAISNGATSNPEFPCNRRSPKRSRNGMTPNGPGLRPFLPQTPKLVQAPALAQHLLGQAEDLMISATHHSFLSHAGCGSLTENALNQWLAQIGYISRSLVSFTGALIGKIRIPETANLECDSTFRCLDLLCSAVNNTKRELEFLEATKRIYGLNVNFDEPNPPTKGFIDLFHSASCPSATLLEGMVVLWAIEVVSSVLLLSKATSKPRNTHITALHEAFIENWKSEKFRRFVDACRSMVDELDMAQTTGNGRAEMLACERVFEQSIWLWGQMFPDVIGMGELDGLDDRQNNRNNGANNAADGDSSADQAVEGDNEDVAHASVDSPGTELGSVVAAN